MSHCNSLYKALPLSHTILYYYFYVYVYTYILFTTNYCHGLFIICSGTRAKQGHLSVVRGMHSFICVFTAATVVGGNLICSLLDQEQQQQQTLVGSRTRRINKGIMCTRTKGFYHMNFSHGIVIVVVAVVGGLRKAAKGTNYSEVWLVRFVNRLTVAENRPSLYNIIY